MIAQSRSLQIERIEKIGNNLPLAGLRPGLNPTLILIASIQINRPSLILVLDNIDKPCHIYEPPILILLAGVLTDEGFRECSAMDIIGTHYCQFEDVGGLGGDWGCRGY